MAAGSSDAGRPRVAVVRLGCRVAQADTDAALRACGAGFAVAAAPDAVLVSTCAVTADAESAAFQAVRRATREHPAVPVVVCGCLGALKRRELETIDGVAAVLGAGDVEGIANAIALLSRRAPSRAGDGACAPGQGTRARPVLKIQDGCDQRCAYCVVPLARGASRSVSWDSVVQQVAALGRIADEVVLAGVHLGAWGGDMEASGASADQPRRGSSSLSRLITEIAERRLVRRLRLSSIDPLEFPLDVLTGAAREVLCPSFHLPVQSGSDRILAAMRRPYRAAAVADLVRRIEDAVPGACITADLIAGFPGETGADHRETVALVRALPLVALHVFPFSRREGTAAATLPSQVPPELARERSAELRAISDAAWGGYVDRQRGREVEAVVERVAGGEARGTTREGVLALWRAASGTAPGRGRAVALRAISRERDALRCEAI